jgi:hypothetical protein
MKSPLSVAQLAGYVAFGLGVFAFFQKDDRRLRASIGVQALSYAVHFLLLGTVAAAAASLVTFVRAMTSLYTRSSRAGMAFIAANLIVGITTAVGAASWFPVAASTLGTIAFFWFDGIAMRLILLGATGCWLVNNLVVGSIGGTMLELFIGVTNGTTIYRLWRAEPRGPARAGE